MDKFNLVVNSLGIKDYSKVGVPIMDIKPDVIAEVKYVKCSGCGFVMSWLEHSLLKVAMPCPRCKSKMPQFGPGIYTESFTGYTLKEILEALP